MKFILIILLIFCSCSSTFTVNGHKIKQRTRTINKREIPVLVSSFIFGYSVVTLYRP